MPERVVRSRTRGFRLPPNAVCVTRPGRWGNPFDFRIYGKAEAVRLYRDWLLNTPEGQEIAEAAKVELRGRNLACWCPLSEPCHGNVLLEMVNRGTEIVMSQPKEEKTK